MILCPVCGGDRSDGYGESMELLQQSGMKWRAQHDPGGIFLEFTDGRRLRLFGNCDSCDLARVRKFLEPGQESGTGRVS